MKDKSAEELSKIVREALKQADMTQVGFTQRLNKLRRKKGRDGKEQSVRFIEYILSGNRKEPVAQDLLKDSIEVLNLDSSDSEKIFSLNSGIGLNRDSLEFDESFQNLLEGNNGGWCIDAADKNFAKNIIIKVLQKKYLVVDNEFDQFAPNCFNSDVSLELYKRQDDSTFVLESRWSVVFFIGKEIGLFSIESAEHFFLSDLLLQLTALKQIFGESATNGQRKALEKYGIGLDITDEEKIDPQYISDTVLVYVFSDQQSYAAFCEYSKRYMLLHRVTAVLVDIQKEIIVESKFLQGMFYGKSISVLQSQ